jgi:cell division protein FtsB
MRTLLSKFFRQCASLVGIPGIHARLDRLEQVSARKVDIEGLDRAVRLLEDRVRTLHLAAIDYVDERIDRCPEQPTT